MQSGLKYILSAILIAIAAASFGKIPDTTIRDAEILSDTNGKRQTDSTLSVSVLTAFPGSEIYELYGHTGLRIRSEKFDSVWNYGVFDFNEPNFILRWTLGKADYKLVGSTFEEFMYPYRIQKRRVVEQVLNLRPEEISVLLNNLQENALPENSSYRYNFLRDNCSTRVFDQIESAINDTIPINSPLRYHSYRDEIKNYHNKYKWYNLGVDIALGSDIDQPLTKDQQLFLPVELMRTLNYITLSNGRKLVTETHAINDIEIGITGSPTHDHETPMFWFCLANLLSFILCMAMIFLKKINRTIYTVVFSIIGLVGLLLCYLIFLSEHPATSNNFLLIWLNPLGLVVPALIWIKNRPQWLIFPYMIANCIGILIFLILWPIFHQTINYALFPIVMIDFMFSATFVLIRYKDVLQLRRYYEEKGRMPKP